MEIAMTMIIKRIVSIINMSTVSFNLEASATAADPSSIDVICRLGGKGQVTPVKHTWG
jgi:hypothetical protein